jgi:hypothetical protein
VARVSAITTSRSAPPPGVGTSEHGDTPLADTGEVADRLFEFSGVQIATGPDDHVLDPAGDVQVGVRYVAEVAGVEPVVVKQRACRVGVVEIAGRRRRTAELDAALTAVAQPRGVGVDLGGEPLH